MTLLAACSRLTLAPSVPRRPAMVWMAALIVVRAAWAAAAVVKPAVPTPPEKVPPLLKPKLASVVVETIELPVSGGPAAPTPETIDVRVTVDAPANAVADALATVPVP